MTEQQEATKQQTSDDPWDIKKLGWKFGSDSSALVALRGCLERGDASFRVGRNTLYDALREYSEVRAERDGFRRELEELHRRTSEEKGDMLAALEKYGNHTKACPASLQPFNETPCECGWREAYPDIDQARHAAAQGGA